MKVAYVCADLGIPIFGKKGASIHVQEIIRALLKRGDQVSLFAAKLGGAVPEDLQEIEVFSFDTTASASAGHDDATNQREAQAQCVAEALHQQMLCCGLFDLVYERYSLWSTAGCRYAEEHQIPCITEVNAPLILEQAAHRRLIDVDRAHEIEQQVFTRSSSIIAVSKEVALYIEASTSDVAPVTVIANGVNIERFTSPRDAGLKHDKDEITIGFVGTLKPWHGVDLLIHAFAEVHRQRPKTRLMIVGDGPMRESLEHLTQELEIAKAVDWIGSVDAATVPSFVAQFDIAVAPYPKLEEFYFSPLKLFEYMASGVPVVASRIGQICEFVDEDVDGLLVDAGDVAQLADALCVLVENPEQRKLLGEKGRAKAVQHFDWSNVLRRILATVTVPDQGHEHRKGIDYVSSSQES